MTCKNCGCLLTEAPEPNHNEWFIPCLVCGAKNVVSAALEIIGWRD